MLGKGWWLNGVDGGTEGGSVVVCSEMRWGSEVGLNKDVGKGG